MRHAVVVHDLNPAELVVRRVHLVTEQFVQGRRAREQDLRVVHLEMNTVPMDYGRITVPEQYVDRVE